MGDILRCFCLDHFPASSVSIVHILPVLAMKRFVKTIIIAAIIPLLFVAVVLLVRGILLEQRARRLFSTDATQTVLVMGDSHADHAFVENVDYGIKMLTFHSTPMNVSLMRLLELERRGGLTSLRVCVINLCNTSTAQWGYKGQIESTWRMLPFSLRYVNLVPMSRWRLVYGLLEITARNLNEMPPVATDASTRGEQIPMIERSEEWIKASAKAAIKRHFGSREENPEKFIPDAFIHLDKAIVSIKEVCDRHGIKLVFFSAPLCKEYSDNVPEWGRENLARWVSRVKELGAYYFDYREWGTRECFYDPDHLCKKGAEKFTKMFYEEVLHPLLLRDEIVSPTEMNITK